MKRERGFHIRDTLVLPVKLRELPDKNVAEIMKIKAEFEALGYVDFRTEMGPDQIRRLTVNQSKELDITRNKAFELESRVRFLLKTEEELAIMEEAVIKEERQAKLNSLLGRKRQIESFLQRQLNSKRDNFTKREYKGILEEIADLN